MNASEYHQEVENQKNAAIQAVGNLPISSTQNISDYQGDERYARCGEEFFLMPGNTTGALIYRAESYAICTRMFKYEN